MLKSIDIRKKIQREEFDYQTLMEAMSDLAYPRDKITQLLKDGVLIRVRKGLYIFGEDYRKQPYSREVLANLIYGPSYISLEYALQYYGYIPERVENVTSITLGRSRSFSTPVGTFIYRQVPVEAYNDGMDLIPATGGATYLMALPEKALVDKVQNDRYVRARSMKDIGRYLLDDLRMETADLQKMNSKRIAVYAAAYGSRKVGYLVKYIKRINRQ